jgi:cellulose synthase/poly-beta-1,6-N-acetylglucosamine synthase-like glycosyltransferase
MTTPETLTLVAYFFVLSILGIYGWHRYFIVWQYMKNKDQVPGPPPFVADWPVVTVQLPIYNEMYVADRLIDSVCDLDYPLDRLEIQVLDDSTDETREIAELAVRRQAQRGYDIKYLHRTDRTGYKAGALQEGCKVARGEFIAIFDADFVPPVDFLRKTVPYFVGEENQKVAVVQARWGHLNQNYSLLTKVQAVMLDGHFVLEHGGRNRGGCFFNFNGTAGVWRRIAIDDAGGWQHDTLTEDLDLSYRAQLRGWQFKFLPDLVTPAEVPVEMNAFKSQQHRWAKGSIQTCRKLLPHILVADLPRKVKVEAFFHLTANFNYLLMVLLSILMFPAMYVRYQMGWTEMLLIDIPLFAAATLSVFNFYLISQREAYPDWKSRVKYLPVVMAIGIGLAVNNAKAVLEALFGQPGEFTRTPKYGIEQRQDDWQHKKYHQALPVQPFVEVALGLYFTFTVFYALTNEIYGTLPFLVLFQFGFLYMGLVSIFQQFKGDDLFAKAPQIAGGK